jgi:hypothetical protein
VDWYPEQFTYFTSHDNFEFKLLTFQVITAASMKMTVFWVAAPCSLAEVYRRFRGPCCLHHQGDEIALIMEQGSTSEASDTFSQTTRRKHPEDSHLHTYFCWIRASYCGNVFINICLTITFPSHTTNCSTYWHNHIFMSYMFRPGWAIYRLLTIYRILKQKDGM